MVEQIAQSELVETMDGLLHELSQPLTVLQCRLAMAEFNREPHAMHEAIAAALEECVRLNGAVVKMRETLAVALEGAE